MTRKPAWRYKCDFCGKTGYSGGHMGWHEKACTMNPGRICRVHHHATGDDSAPKVADLVAALTRHGSDWKAAMDEVRELAGNCPACILAAIRQSGLQKYEIDPDTGQTISEPPDFGFDYKKEVAEMWANANEAAFQAEQHCYY